MLLQHSSYVMFFCLAYNINYNVADETKNNKISKSNDNLFPFDVADPLVAAGEMGAFRVTPGFENDPRVEAFALSLQQIHCYSEHMIVYLQRNILAKAGITRKYQLSFNSGSKYDSSCFPSDKGTNSTHFVLATFYSMCGTTKILNKQILSYHNWVILKIPSLDINASIDERFEQENELDSDKFIQFTVAQGFYCTHYLRKSKSNLKLDDVSNEIFDDHSHSSNDSRDASMSNSKFTFRLKLYDGPWVGNPWIKYPKVVYEKQTIYAQLQLNQTVLDDDLRPLVKECYFSQKSNPTYEPRFNLISSGCPVINSALVHSRSSSNHQISRFTFEAGQYFDNIYMFFHCKVSVCSQEGEREREGFEKCPTSTACTEKSVRATDIQLVNSVTSFISSGPLRPIFIEGDRPTNRRDDYQFYSTVAPTVTTCPPCPKLQTMSGVESNELNYQSHRQVLTTGMSIYTVVGIATASFVVGVALMGGLWKVHDLTEPKKIPSHKRNTAHDFSSKGDNYCLEPTACTPMTESSVVSSIFSSKFSSLRQ